MLRKKLDGVTRVMTSVIGLSVLAFPLSSVASAEEQRGQTPINTSEVPRNMNVIAPDGSGAEWPPRSPAIKGAPNIVVILLNDVGYAAAGTFGGAVPTPGMSRLAESGLSYNNFHTKALCSPTRASLLTGRNPHKVGFGAVMEMASGLPGYNGIWNEGAKSVATVLQKNGYRTAAFGKWHNTPMDEISGAGSFTRWPTGRGFDFFYGFHGGGANQYHPLLYRNTNPIDPAAPATGEYNLGEDLTDQAINWAKQHQALAPENPYFLYFASGATHEPHQPPRHWIERYRGRFDGGWDKLREETFARQKKLGFIPANANLTPRPKEIPAWASLSADEKRLYAYQMEVFAAYLAYTDYQVDRLVRNLQAMPGGDNTLIFYVTGDNGASAEGGILGRDLLAETGWPSVGERLQRMGELKQGNHAAQYSAGWAWATSSPFQWRKQTASHFGGTANPLIVSWPRKLGGQAGGLRPQFTHVNDVVPTIYEIVGIPAPDEVDGVKQMPIDGTSMAYTFSDTKAPTRKTFQMFETGGSRAIYKDGWIAAARHSYPWDFNRKPDFDQDKWQLYNVNIDFSQAKDLSSKHPAMLEALKQQFESEARNGNIYPLNHFFASPGGALGAEQPRLSDGQTRFLYPPLMTRIASGQGPDFRRSHSISLEIKVNDRPLNGVILSSGTSVGGFVLYAKDNRLLFEYSHRGLKRFVLTSDDLPGNTNVKVRYDYERPPDGKPGGVGRLYIDDAKVGEIILPYFESPGFGTMLATLNLGRSSGGPVSDQYSGDFPLSAKMSDVEIVLR